MPLRRRQTSMTTWWKSHLTWLDQLAVRTLQEQREVLNTHTQRTLKQVLKPTSPTQYSVTGAGNAAPPVPSLSGSTSTSILRDKRRRSVTGGKKAYKRPRDVTFASDEHDKDWEACTDIPLGQ
eukprot:3867272-Rhodomonas_salina.1